MRRISNFPIVLAFAGALLLVAGTAVPASAGAPGGGWQLKQRDDAPDAGYVLYARPRAGSSYAEYRMEVALDAELDAVMAALEHNLLDPDTYPEGFERKVLRREGSSILSHDLIDVPFLADRDVVVRIQIDRDPKTGAPHLRWSDTREEGPAPRDGVVRMPSSKGSWTLSRRAGGGTLAVYQAHVELGGSLPAAFVEARMPMEIARQAVELRRTMRERLVAKR